MNNYDLISTNVFPNYEVPCIPEEEEIWVQKPPQEGDHIRVQRMNGLYAHHGIYVSDEEVIHFTGKDDDSILDWSKPEVIQTDLAYFLKGGILEVKEYLKNKNIPVFLKIDLGLDTEADGVQILKDIPNLKEYINSIKI